MTVSINGTGAKKQFTGKVLIVEDEAGVRESLARILRTRGHEVIEESSGVEALSKIYTEQPDLILLDIQIPGLDGLELCRAVREDPSIAMIPIVIVTGFKDRRRRISALNVGANEFLQKPVDEAELFARTQALLRMKWLSDEMNRQNQQLEEQVHARTAQLNAMMKKLEIVQEEVLYRLSLAAEFKDQTAPGHLKRIQRYVEILARAIGVPNKEIYLFSRASVLHDIGKIGIPESILLKPGPLNEEERKIVEQHPLIGGKILEDSHSDLLQFAEIIARTHHERYDGRGYPKGLRNDEIPLAGRIVALADVFDALTHKRCYKEAFSFDESVGNIRDEKGKHFCPDLVEACLDVKEEMKLVSDQVKEEMRSGGGGPVDVEWDNPDED